MCNKGKKDMNRFAKRDSWVAGLLLGLLLVPVPALAATNVTTDWGSTNKYGAGGDLFSGAANGGTITVDVNTGNSNAGAIFGGNSTGSNANNNIVIIKNGKGRNVFGGATSSGSASGNTVTVYKGTWEAIYGGNTFAVAGDASNNHVIVRGGTIDLVYAGVAISGSVNDNIVDIYAGAIINEKIMGGSSLTGSGNTLNLFGWKGTTQQLAGFQKLNFYLPATMQANDTVLTTTGKADIKNATINVGFQGGTALVVGDTITLIDASTATTFNASGNNTTTSGEGMVGISQRATFDIIYDTLGKKVDATLTSLGGNEQLKSLAESRMSGLGMLTQGIDILATQGIHQLRTNALYSYGPVAFGVMGGQSLRYNSGSHVDVDGFNLATGLGWNFPMNDGNSGNLLLGAFFEAGWGSYDSHNSFGNAASVKGDGDTNYYGAGILARYDTAPIGPGNIYLETSFRAGKVETDYNSDGFETASGNEVSFDSSAAYYGAHAGLGYIWNISEVSSLDIYTKYLWTRQDSDSVTIEGDNIRFKAMDSNRWRTGAKFSHALTTDSGLVFTPYVGAAYEYEFDSKARASSNGDPIDAPDIKGGTGIGELGFSFKPSATSGLSLDLGMQGYTGKREGVGGSCQVKFEF